jgi:hypothetical protein
MGGPRAVEGSSWPSEQRRRGEPEKEANGGRRRAERGLAAEAGGAVGPGVLSLQALVQWGEDERHRSRYRLEQEQGRRDPRGVAHANFVERAGGNSRPSWEGGSAVADDEIPRDASDAGVAPGLATRRGADPAAGGLGDAAAGAVPPPLANGVGSGVRLSQAVWTTPAPGYGSATPRSRTLTARRRTRTTPPPGQHRVPPEAGQCNHVSGDRLRNGPYTEGLGKEGARRLRGNDDGRAKAANGAPPDRPVAPRGGPDGQRRRGLGGKGVGEDGEGQSTMGPQ